jgi:hypothetical protein
VEKFTAWNSIMEPVLWTIVTNTKRGRFLVIVKFCNPTVEWVMTRGLDTNELFFLNADCLSSTIPSLVAWIKEISLCSNVDTSTELDAAAAKSSRDVKGMAMLEDDKPLMLDLKLLSTVSLLSWEGYSCVDENNIKFSKVCTS